MMDYRWSPEAEAFRAEVRAFLAEAMADATDHRDPTALTGLDEAFERDLHRRAGARGWLSLTGEHKAVFEHEVARADAPLIDTAMTLAGFAVRTFGSDEQRRELLPRMAAGEVLMCIAYTEEGAGSDLSTIETTATPYGDGWVLAGRKILVTAGHKADWCCTIARTGDAMTMFLVDLSTSGVEVVRRPTMNGWTLEDLTFHDVRLPAGAVLGDVGAGWRQLAAAMASERTGMFWIGFAHHVLDLLVEQVRATAADDPIARDALARCAIAVADADRLARRAWWTATPGALPAMAKVAATEALQLLAQEATALAGLDGLTWTPLHAAEGRFAYEYLERVHGTISVGANELQRDVIAQAGLGLPRRP